jgi:alpha-L-fucosidase
MHWQTDTSLSNGSWGFIENDTYKTPEFIIHLLADVVSKNGNLLLNVGPRPDGTIPEPAQQVLHEVGEWLKVNGEAIYSTRPWRVYGEGPTKVSGGPFHENDTKPYTPEDFRFTRNGGSLYAIELGWPKDGRVIIHTLGDNVPDEKMVAKVALLGSSAKIEWQQEADGLHLQLPAEPVGKYAYTFRVSFK